MKTVTMLGDYLSEAQLRTLVRDYQVEQKHGSMESRARKELSGVEAVRARVQNYRHRRQRGEWKTPKPYLSQEEAIARYERRGERLESREQMFAIGQGQSTRKHTDIRATAVKGGRGGRITHRPTINEGMGNTKRVRTKSVSHLVGYRV